MDAGDAGFAGFLIFQLVFWGIWAVLMAAAIGLLVVHIVALVDVANIQGWQFVPPGDAVKSSWLLGLGLAFVIPFGNVVTVIMWWKQVRAPKRAGQLVGRPFWMSSAPVYPVYPVYPPPGPGVAGMPPPGWAPPPSPPAEERPPEPTV